MATYYWVGGNGTWDGANTTNWSASSGGAGGAGVPNSSDTVIFDSLSGTGTCTTASGSACSVATLNSSTLGLTLGANHTMNGLFTLTLGALNLNNFTLTARIFSSSTSNVRSIAFGTGDITLTGSNDQLWNSATATNFSYTGSGVINCTYSGAVGLRFLTVHSTGGTEANSLNFNISAGTDATNFAGSSVVKSINFTGYSGAYTSFSKTIFGNLIFSSGMSIIGGAGINTFAATSGTQQITTNGKTLDFPITQNSPGATFQLQDNLTMGSTRTFTLTNGALDLNNQTLSTGLFSSSNSNTRSIAFGTGNITLTGNATNVWVSTTSTNFSYTGTPTVNLTYAGAVGNRNIFATASAANALNFNVTAGTDRVIFQAGFTHGNINYTGFAGTTDLGGINIVGDLTLVSGVTVTASASAIVFNGASKTQKITSGGVTIDMPFTFNGVGSTFQLQDNLTTGITRITALTNGTLDLTGNGGNWTLTTGLFQTTNSNVRSIAFGTGNITVIGSGLVWLTTTATNFSYTGTPTINVSNNSATAATVSTGAMTPAQALDFNFTTGTYALTEFTTTSVYRSINFTGFAGTIANNARIIYGSATFSTGMTLTAGTNITTFASTSAGNTITSAGKTLDFPLTFDGVGGVWTCQDALTLGSTRALTMVNGTLNLKSGATSTVGSFVTTGSNQKYLGSSTPGTQATISDASGTNDVSYLTIQDSNAVGGATWNAFVNQQNVDAGNNDGWDFGISPIVGSYEYTYQLRSFTQPRRF